MNPEHHESEHRPDSEQAALVRTQEEYLAIVQEGIDRYGKPFVAYLTLDGVEQRSRDLVAQHGARYRGSFPDRTSFVRWAIEDQGWNDALVAFRCEQGMWPDDVKWHLDAAWEHLSGLYALTERLGGVHAFQR